MSLLDWIARKQRDKLTDSRDTTVSSIERTVDSLERKVATNTAEQIRLSSFSSVRQRDSLVMQRVLGQQPVKGER